MKTDPVLEIVRPKKLTDLLWGDPGQNTLETRIVNAITLIGAFAGCLTTMANFLLQNPLPHFISSIGAILIGLVFYSLSRIFRVGLANNFAILSFLFLLCFQWIEGEGISGTVPYVFFILFVCTIIIIKQGMKMVFILLELGAIVVLLLVEHFHPDWIVHCQTETQRFYDLATCLLIALVIVITAVHIVFLQYIWEKEAKETLLKQTLKDKEEMEKALHEIKQLQGILPICSLCKKIRNDKGYWEQVEQYIHNHSEAEFTHGICPECARRLYNFDPDKQTGEKVETSRG